MQTLATNLIYLKYRKNTEEKKSKTRKLQSSLRIFMIETQAQIV